MQEVHQIVWIKNRFFLFSNLEYTFSVKLKNWLALGRTHNRPL